MWADHSMAESHGVTVQKNLQCLAQRSRLTAWNTTHSRKKRTIFAAETDTSSGSPLTFVGVLESYVDRGDDVHLDDASVSATRESSGARNERCGVSLVDSGWCHCSVSREDDVRIFLACFDRRSTRSWPLTSVSKINRCGCRPLQRRGVSNEVCTARG